MNRAITEEFSTCHTLITQNHPAPFIPLISQILLLLLLVFKHIWHKLTKQKCTLNLKKKENRRKVKGSNHDSSTLVLQIFIELYWNMYQTEVPRSCQEYECNKQVIKISLVISTQGLLFCRVFSILPAAGHAW